MKTTKKLFSIILAVMIVCSMIPASTLAANAANYSVSDYSALKSAVNSYAAGSTIRLADDIVFPSERSAGNGYDDITLPNKALTIYLDGHKLDLGAYTLTAQGALTLSKGTEDGGEIIADETALTIKGSTASLQTSSGIKISSRNGDAVVSKLTKKRDIKIEGAKLSAPNGSAVFIGGYCTQLYLTGATLIGKYGITADFSQAAAPSGAIISNVYINSAVIDASEKVINNNTENVGNGYNYNFYQIIRFFIKTGSFSENIFENYPDIQWRDPDVGILTTYPEMVLYNGFYTIIPEIVSEDELSDAFDFGGIYSLSSDINLNNPLVFDADVVIIGNGHTIKATSSMTNMIQVNSDSAGSLTFDNVKINSNSLVKHFYYNNSPLNANNSDTALVLNNSEIKGCKSNTAYGAIVTKGYQKLTIDSTTIQDNETLVSSGEYRASVLIGDNCTASVKDSIINFKNGAKIINEGELRVSGSTVMNSTSGGVILNRGELTINDGEYTSPDGESVIDNETDGTITVNGGVFSSEVYAYMCGDKFLVRSQDNTSDGLYTVRDDFGGSMDVEENNQFDLNINSYLNLQILGVQKKHDIDNVYHSAQEKDHPENSIRFITAVNEGLIKGNNVEDYGYIIAKVTNKQPNELYPTRVFDVLKYKAYNGEKTLSCKGTFNTVVTDKDYGTASKSTTYKYVTLSVNNIEAGSSIVARFYLKTKDGKIYYGPYKKIANNETLPGIAASLESLQ